MKLREKTLLVIGLTLVGLVGVLYATASTILMNQVRNLEVDYTKRGVQRALDALAEDINNLTVPVRQLAVWDDTYLFMQQPNARYLETNFSDDTFSDYRLNIALLIDRSGKVVFSKNWDFKKSQSFPIEKEILQHLKPNSLLLKHSHPDSIRTGIILLPENPLLIVSHPIVKNTFQGDIQGTMVMGRYLTPEEIKRLSVLTQLNIDIYLVKSPQLSTNLQLIINSLVEQSRNSIPNQIESKNKAVFPLKQTNVKSLATAHITAQQLDENTIAGYNLITDIYGQPALLLQVKLPRTIYNQGKNSLSYLLWSLVGVGVVFGIGNLFLLEKLVLSRLARLSTGVKNIGSSGDLSMRVSAKGNDELSSLGLTINWMLEALERSLKELKIEREKAEKLLLNILPEVIAVRLKKDSCTIADNFAEATVLFADIVGFTKMAAHTSPVELVNLLNQIFSAFDRLVEQHGLEKIKTIGDAYMVVGGLPIPRPDHAEAMAEMALDMQREIEKFNTKNKVDFSMRIGINTGPVVAGVIGIKKFIYDLWGDTVNTASRMESHGLPGCIQVTEATYNCLKEKYVLQERGVIQIKGKGEMTTYLLIGRKENQESGVRIQESEFRSQNSKN
ncbi:MAG TPA: adenylate/guanylate cyclase domain-containing protein [Leptolyngbyaceae cyanobacterium]